MAKNITLMGANYPDVPAVDLPQTGGGTARFVDMDEVIKIDGVQVTTGSDGMFTIDGYSGKHVFSIIASSYDDYFVIFRPSSVQGRYICYAYNASFGKQANKVFNVNIFYVDD